MPTRRLLIERCGDDENDDDEKPPRRIQGIKNHKILEEAGRH